MHRRSREALRLRKVVADTRQLIPESSRRQLDAAQVAEQQLGILFQHMFARRVHALERWQPQPHVNTNPAATVQFLQSSNIAQVVLLVAQDSAWLEAVFDMVKSNNPAGKATVRAIAVLLRQMLAVVCGASASKYCTVQNALPLHDWNAFSQFLASRTAKLLHLHHNNKVTTIKDTKKTASKASLSDPHSNKSRPSDVAAASLVEFLSQRLSPDEASEGRAMVTGQRWRLWPRVGLGPITNIQFCREMVRMHPLFESELMAVDTLMCQCMTPPASADSVPALSALQIPLVEVSGDWTRWFHELRHTQFVVAPDTQEPSSETTYRKLATPSHIIVFQDCRVTALESLPFSECYYGVGVYNDRNSDFDSATTVEWRRGHASEKPRRGNVWASPSWLADPDSPGLIQQWQRQSLIFTMQRGHANL